jgi:tetratricopeptide (TPR) repeat protein
MTGATLLIILVLSVGVALFFFILHFSKVQKNHSNESEERIPITQVSMLDESTTRLSSPSLTIIKAMKKIQNILLQIVSFIQNKFGHFQKSFNKPPKVQNPDVLYKQDRSIQQAVKEQELIKNQGKNSNKGIDGHLDTSFLEKTTPKPTKKSDDLVVLEPDQVTQLVPESQAVEEKIDSFVSEVSLTSDQLEEALTHEESNQQGVSDSHYYELMEKRYIDKIITNPKDIAAYKKLGDLYVEMDNLDDAKEAYKVVLKLKPQDEIVRRKLKELTAKT